MAGETRRTEAREEAAPQSTEATTMEEGRERQRAQRIWAAANLSAQMLLGGDLRLAATLKAYEPPHHGPSPTQPYSFYLMEHDGPTPVPNNKTSPCPFDDSDDPGLFCTHPAFEGWLGSFGWARVGNNFFTGLYFIDTFRASGLQSPPPPPPARAACASLQRRRVVGGCE